MRDFCNDLCIRILSSIAAWFGMRLVAADATVLPKGWMMFDPLRAKEIGLNKAVIFQGIDGWVQHNRRKHQNVKGGRAWSYNSIPDWGKVFCWLNSDYVGKLIRELEDAGLLVSAKLAKKKSDQTKHYSTEAGIIYESEPQQMSFWPVENIQMRGRKAQDDSSIGTRNSNPAKGIRNRTPTPARVIALFGGVGVFKNHVPGKEMPERMPEVPEMGVTRRDSSDLEGVDETRPTHVSPYPPVARGPFPDDTTERGDTTEEETKSSGDTKPVDVPPYAQIFALADAEVRVWITQDGERLKAWCAYAAAAESIHEPGGFVRAAMRISGQWPIPPKPKFYTPTGQDYITGELADFIEH